MFAKNTWLIFLCTLFLITTGVVMVYSSSAAIGARKSLTAAHRQDADLTTVDTISAHSTDYLKKQAVFAGLGLILLLAMYNVDYESLRKYATPLLVVSFVLLVSLYILPNAIAPRINGAKRWLSLGGINFQVSELAKLAMILYMAKKICERQDVIKSFVKGFIPFAVVFSLFFVVIILEPDLGASFLLGVIVYIMWFVGGMRITHLLSVFFVAIPVITVAILIEPFRRARVMSYIQMIMTGEAQGDRDWQIRQSFISVATGGISGVGLGQGHQKYLYLSEGHTDFIFAGICEELGMIGAITVFSVYSLLMILGIRTAIKAQDLYGSLLAAGITVMICVQAFINIYVVLGNLPTKGFTLPLVSYGGSSLLINCIAIGILMNISRYNEMMAAPVRRQSLATAVT